MLSGSGEAGAATVFPISAARCPPDFVALLAEECPGWDAAYLPQEDQWIARRRGGLMLCDDTTDPRSLVVTAADFVTLYIQVNLCSIGIILADYPDWHLACDQAEQTWSATLPATADHGSYTVHALTPARLLHGIRLHVASIGQDEQEPWLRLWGEQDEC